MELLCRRRVLGRTSAYSPNNIKDILWSVHVPALRASPAIQNNCGEPQASDLYLVLGHVSAYSPSMGHPHGSPNPKASALGASVLKASALGASVPKASAFGLCFRGLSLRSLFSEASAFGLCSRGLSFRSLFPRPQPSVCVSEASAFGLCFRGLSLRSLFPRPQPSVSVSEASAFGLCFRGLSLRSLFPRPQPSVSVSEASAFGLCSSEASAFGLCFRGLSLRSLFQRPQPSVFVSEASALSLCFLVPVLQVLCQGWDGGHGPRGRALLCRGVAHGVLWVRPPRSHLLVRHHHPTPSHFAFFSFLVSALLNPIPVHGPLKISPFMRLHHTFLY